MSVDCIVADDNPLLDFISIKNLNLNLFVIEINSVFWFEQYFI